MIFCSDSLEFLRKQEDYSFDINYSDPPYALGSEVIIRPDGKVDYKKANDFMNKWEMPTGAYWEQWFKEAYRTLKYGGYCIMFGMDRQLLLFKYYANLAGFTEKQSLYWYYISNFPKATDLSKMIDKNAGAEREVGAFKYKNGKTAGGERIRQLKGGAECYESIASTDLAKKYDGYKYSISPLKQTNETILVFQKPYKTGSCLRDTLAYENGDETCCCGALDIDGNRVEPLNEKDLKDIRSERPSKTSNANEYTLNHGKLEGMDRSNRQDVNGRYPAQTFIDSNTAEVLGECSKILHKCDFEKDEHDLYFYNPKVSKSERNAGCEDMEERSITKKKGNGLGRVCNMCGAKQLTPCDCTNNEWVLPSNMKNNHPTLKPIKLNKNILSLFKTPNEQQIVYPFAGSGSEVIGGIKAGFTNYIGCEINQEYIDIANARIEFWKDFEGVKPPKTQKIAEGQIYIWDLI